MHPSLRSPPSLNYLHLGGSETSCRISEPCAQRAEAWSVHKVLRNCLPYRQLFSILLFSLNLRNFPNGSRQKGYNISQRNNLWLLTEALCRTPVHLTLIALWDGETGDGPGGSQY